jgi:GT2 family glycosyltransferase
MDDPKKLDSAGSFFTVLGVQEHLSKVTVKSVKLPKDIFAAKTACTLVRKSVYEKLGGFDEDYFVYFVDPDLCWRIWQIGYRVVLAADSIAFHKGGTANVHLNTGFVVYQSFKNRINSLVKNLEIRYFYVLAAHLAVCMAGSFLFLLRLKGTSALAIWKAILVSIVQLPEIVRKRRATQKMRKISDKEIFSKTSRKISLRYLLSESLAYTKEW